MGRMDVPVMEAVPTLPSLFTGISADVQKLLRQEKALVTAEVQDQIVIVKSIAVVFAIISSLFLTAMALVAMAGFYGLRELAVPVWASFLTIGVIYLVIGLFLVFKKWR